MKFQSKLKLFHQRKRMSKCGLPNGGHVAQGGCSTHDQGQGHSSQPATMPNRPISQIPQCTSPISHNASFCNRNVHISVTKWCIVGYLWYIVGFVRWVYSLIPSPILNRVRLLMELPTREKTFALIHQVPMEIYKTFTIDASSFHKFCG